MKDLGFLKSSLIAHRGYHDKQKKIPENSLKAFQRAIDYGYIIELDVHLLKDKEIIVFHDDNLKRMTGIDKEVKNCTLQEIRKYSLMGTKNTIPTLKEVLSLVNGKVPIIIELKYDVLGGKLEEELVKILDNYDGQFAVKSFHPFIVRWFLKNRPNYIRGQLVSHVHKTPKEWLVWSMITNLITKPDFISCHYNLLQASRVRNYRRKHLVLTWTIRDKDAYQKVLNKADNYICENIYRILEK